MHNQIIHQFEKKIAIVIPSLQRLDYLERLLLYFTRINFPFKVYVGNYSNDQKNKENIFNLVNKYNTQLDICLYFLKANTLFTAMRELLNAVEENFTVAILLS